MLFRSKGYAFQGEIVSEVIVSPKYGSGDQIFHAEYPNAEKFKRRQNEEGTTDSTPATQPAVEDEEKGRVLEGRK